MRYLDKVKKAGLTIITAATLTSAFSQKNKASTPIDTAATSTSVLFQKNKPVTLLDAGVSGSMITSGLYERPVGITANASFRNVFALPFLGADFSATLPVAGRVNWQDDERRATNLTGGDVKFRAGGMVFVGYSHVDKEGSHMNIGATAGITFVAGKTTNYVIPTYGTLWKFSLAKTGVSLSLKGEFYKVTSEYGALINQYGNTLRQPGSEKFQMHIQAGLGYDLKKMGKLFKKQKTPAPQANKLS